MPAHYPQECPERPPMDRPYSMPKWEVEEDIVISGISGRFPESENMEELRKNLYEGIDMITEDDRRWKPGLMGTPRRMGKLNDISKFDAFFFGVHGKQATMLDPQSRLLLETTYEAIFDSGYDPASLRGKNVGVFVGCSGRSTDDLVGIEDQRCGYELLGFNLGMMSNRISFTFDFKGPSFTMDTACSASFHALNEAILALRTNRCEAAIVGGSHISLNPNTTISFVQLGLMATDGKCKVFDAAANGYVRSEGVSSILLQRASAARRSYGTVLHIKINNDGAKSEGISFPSSAMQFQLYREIYSELNMDPMEVDYLEAHGTGTVAGDREENNAVAEFFCKGRKEPFPIGSVKSNLGHAEPASGMCSLAKVILSAEEGMIAPNLHYNTPNPDVLPLVQGILKVVDVVQPLPGDIIAINNFGFGGSNSHMVFKRNTILPPPRKERKIPHLTLACGRTEESVHYIFRKIQELDFTDEALVLLEEACKSPTTGMSYRGYALVGNPGDEMEVVVKNCRPEPRPLWFLFSGMGSQWSGMAKDMMKLDVFAKSVRMSAQVLKPLGVDLIYLLTEASDEELNEIVAPFVTIAAVQIALVDMMRKLGMEPEGIVGHSVGELGCAYADGCFTAEQTIMAAYWRGKSCADSKLIEGAMAAVGLSWEAAKERCPEGVFPVCHNSEDSVTISGPVEAVNKFVQELVDDNIFARHVRSCDIAFHSLYVEPAANIMRKELQKVIPNPLPRSSKWVSCSVPEEQWSEPHAQLSSAEYHVNNLLSPVLFHQAMLHVPKNALIVEFAPHSLFQAIVKRGLGPDSAYIGFMKRGNQENVRHCLQAIGTLYVSNLTPKVKNLYDPVAFPVPRGTPMLNSLIQWDHSQTWNVMRFHFQQENKDVISVNAIKGSPEEYLTDHKVDGRILFPAMGYVWLAWKALAKHLFLDINEVPVVFENVTFLRATMLPKTGPYAGTYHLHVKFQDSSGLFQILEGGSIVATGRLQKADTEEDVLKVKDRNLVWSQDGQDIPESFTLDAQDFYKELRLRGYEYGPSFQGVLNADTTGHNGHLRWDGHWVSFMDAMLQVPILCVPVRALLLPTRIKSLRIDPRIKPEVGADGTASVPYKYNPYINVCTAGPVELQGLKCGIAPRRQDRPSDPVMEEHLFVPHFDLRVMDQTEVHRLEEYSRVCSALAHNILKEAGKNKSEINAVMNGFKEAPEELTQKYLASEQKSHVLLRILKEILDLTKANNGLQDNVKEIMFNHAADLQEDILSSASCNENVLRASLDIFLDNHFSTKVKVTEVSADFLFHHHVTKMLGMTTLGMVQVDYAVSRVTADAIPEGLLDPAVKVTIFDSEDAKLLIDNDIVVAKDLFTDSGKSVGETLNFLAESIKEKGFVLLSERTWISPAEKFLSILSGKSRQEQRICSLEESIRKSGLLMVSKKLDLTSVTYLLRKVQEKVTLEPHVVRISEGADFDWVQDLKQKLKEVKESEDGRRVCLVTDNSTSGVLGFVNCLRNEPGGRHLRVFFEASLKQPKKPESFNLNDTYVQYFLQNDFAMNMFREGECGMLRHRLLNKDPTLVPMCHSFLNITNRGDLSSLSWISSVLCNWPLSPSTKDLIMVNVYYAPLNFRDIMLASGRLPPEAIPGHIALQECILGLEFAGRDTSGRRVMGVVSAQGMASSVAVLPVALMEIPDKWTLEEASTVPVVYLTAYYALIFRGQMKAGESVLVHSGSGGVGQAAIAIALAMDCEVFTTVGSEEKKNFLKERFPQLKDDHISNSRDVEFEYDIFNVTKGIGVDLVLNSLSEEKLQASVRCLKTNGRFLEIGKYDLAMNSPLGMSEFLKNITFHGVLLESILEEGGGKETLIHLAKLLQAGIDSGVVVPLKANVFDSDKAEDAFRLMASGKHIGKVVLKIREEESEGSEVMSQVRIPSVPRTYCHPEKSYLITGGLGGVGLELAGWLVDRGARFLVLSSRSGLRNDYQHLWLQRWRKSGVQVRICHQDISKEEEVKELFDQALEMGPLAGIFHLAMVLHDGLFENLGTTEFEKVCLPKVQGVQQLDELSRQMCPELEYFVVFSSISSGRGNPGQSNYGYANSVMERLMEQRKQDGLHGLAIQWGGIGDVGVVYESMGGNEIVLKGTVPQRLTSCLVTLDRLMQEDHAVVSCFVPAEKAAFGVKNEKDLVALLCKVLGISDPSSVKQEMTLGEMGMDSLMGVEIKQVLETEYDTVLSVPEVRLLSIKDLIIIGSKKDKSDVKSTVLKSSRSVIPFFKTELVVSKDVLVPMNDSKQGGSCVFFVHPIEGHVEMMRDLAAKVKKPAYGLQFTLDVPYASAQEIAACYIEHIKKVQPHGPYHLVGFSLGSMLAFEMALQLQRTDQVATLVCLDGTPEAASQAVQGFMKEDGTKPLHRTLKAFLGSYMLDFPADLERSLHGAGLKEAAERIINLLEGKLEKDVFLVAGEMVSRLATMALEYKTKGIFRGRAIFVKAEDKTGKLKDIPLCQEEDYGLGKLVEGPVIIHRVKGEHHVFLKENTLLLADIINDSAA